MRSGIVVFIICALLLISCNDYLPKPAGYPRIDRVKNELNTFTCPDFSFSYPASVEIKEVKKEAESGFWFNMIYSEYDAIIYCTYLPVDKVNLRSLLNESYHLAYSHVSKADGILQTQFTDSLYHISGIIYDIKGAVASPVQFYVTDSTSSFLRGSLYFNQRVKTDSIAPVVKIIREDIVEIMETLRWKR